MIDYNTTTAIAAIAAIASFMTGTALIVGQLRHVRDQIVTLKVEVNHRLSMLLDVTKDEAYSRGKNDAQVAAVALAEEVAAVARDTAAAVADTARALALKQKDAPK